MRSLCIFSSYFESPHMPRYVRIYLNELKMHFNDVLFIANNISSTDEVFLNGNNILFMRTENEGYDFGMWYKALKSLDTVNYERIGLVNDSTILFGKLDSFFTWLDKENPDFAGLTDSYLLDYHIQSYFLIINIKAIPYMLEYFTKNGIRSDIDEVIRTYEVGLSRYLINAGMNCQAMYNVPEKGEYNYALLQAKSLIKKGFPLVKKKIITRLYTSERWWSMVVIGFDPFPAHYIKLIERKYEVPDNMFKELMDSKGGFAGLKFNLISFMAILLGKISGKGKIVIE